MSEIPSLRARRDFVTNPSFDEVLALIADSSRQETETLSLDARGDSLGTINYQAGVVEGVKRAFRRLESYRENAMEDFKDQ